MKLDDRPVYMIGIAAQLCGVHPQTLRQYERLGLVTPQRVGAKNRLYSEVDISRVRNVQRLTQQLGVNLAGVEIILRLLDNMDELRLEMEKQFDEYRVDAERRIQEMMGNSMMPAKRDESLLPAPTLKWRKPEV